MSTYTDPLVSILNANADALETRNDDITRLLTENDRIRAENGKLSAEIEVDKLHFANLRTEIEELKQREKERGDG